jgi:Family of unknown function (DUF6464)
MALDFLPAELVLSDAQVSLGYLGLDWQPQPGAYIEFADQMYLVLERRHRYQLRSGRYQLHQIVLYVQSVDTPTEGSWQADRWLIGDLTCAYNARSELLRCAVNPAGPCDRCGHYRAV